MICGWVNDDRVNLFKLMCCWLCVSGMCLLLTEQILQYVRVCVCWHWSLKCVWGCNTIKQELVDMAFSFQKGIWIELHLKIGSGMSGRSQHNDSSTSWWSDLPWVCVCEKRGREQAGGGEGCLLVLPWRGPHCQPMSVVPSLLYGQVASTSIMFWH